MITLPNNEHWLIEQARLLPNRNAIVTSRRTITYRELLEQSLSLADYLSSQGICTDQNVCILSNHGFEFWVIVNALWFIGAVPVPLNTRNTIEEISWQTKHVDAKFLITFQHTQQLDNPEFVNHISLDKFSFQAPNTFHHSSFFTPASTRVERGKLRSSLIMFTSGSTGKPKAVVHTFNSLFESVKATDSMFGLSTDDLWLASLPLYHIGGFMILVRSLITGSAVVFPNSLKHEDVIRSVREFNPTYISLVSTTLKRILDENEKPASNLKYVFLGGGPLSTEVCKPAIEAGFPIVKVYGSTETCSMVCALKPEEFIYKPNSAGLPLNEEIKIKSKIKSESTIKNGEEAAEILVSSPTLFKQYFDDDLSTQQKLENGFYHTGDFGWMDDEGFLFVESRREDIIITGGENVSAKEVESALFSLSQIKDNFVFGIKDETWGEIICAVIVCENLSQEEIKTKLKEKIAGFKIPKKFFFVSEIPRNEMGKVNRNELLKQLNFDAV